MATSQQPIYWGQEVFVIPYQWSPETDPSLAAEVVLYASHDRGVSWREVTRARPDVRSFAYRAPSDGEYWFCVKTIDRSGNAWPAGPCMVELRVVVDTLMPTAEPVRAERELDGRITLRSEVADANLTAATALLAVRTSPQGEWSTLPTRTEQTAGGLALSAVLPPGAPATFEARVAVRDAAGNPAEAGVVLDAASIAAAPAGSLSTSTSPFSYASASGPSATGPSFTGPSFGPPAAQVEVTPPTGVMSNPFDDVPGSPLPPPAAPALMAATPAPAPKAAEAATPGVQPESSQGWASAPGEPWPREGTTVVMPNAAQAEGENLPNPTVFQSASLAAGTGAGSLTPNQGTEADLASAVYVASKRFELDYDIQGAGPYGVERVEVWSTADGGASWRQTAIDSDGQSPAAVNVPGPGVFGFRIVVQSVGGLDSAAPGPGEAPEAVVVVDLASPEATLDSVTQGEGYFADHLTITWTAADERLAERPAALFYSSRAEGPWSPIASNLENSGKFRWKLQRHLPSAVYVRLEVRDMAGNVQSSQTPTPTPITLTESAGHIRQVRPLPGLDRQAASPESFR